MIKRNLNGSGISFSQDSRIIFEEVGHTYKVAGIGTMTPVSNVVGMFFKPFDAIYWSKKKCFGNELAAARLREEWEAKGAIESQAGTFMHKQIEDFLSEHIVPQTLVCEVSYSGKYITKRESVDISKEWSFFKRFENDIVFTPFRTEWCIFDEDARIAGTIDLLCSRNDGTYEIYDWKRSKKVDPDEQNQWQNGINGLNHLTDTSYTHYCLQQNLYRYMLEKNYGIKISRMNLVVLHPDMYNYKVVPVPRMEREVQIIINYLKATHR